MHTPGPIWDGKSMFFRPQIPTWLLDGDGQISMNQKAHNGWVLRRSLLPDNEARCLMAGVLLNITSWRCTAI
jgi:hypothetical protein